MDMDMDMGTGHKQGKSPQGLGYERWDQTLPRARAFLRSSALVSLFATRGTGNGGCTVLSAELFKARNVDRLTRRWPSSTYG